jgi:hypothetical protein
MMKKKSNTPERLFFTTTLSFILIKKELGRGVFPRSQDIKRTSKMG